MIEVRSPLDVALVPRPPAWRPLSSAHQAALPDGYRWTAVAGGDGTDFRHVRGEDAAGRALFATRVPISREPEIVRVEQVLAHVAEAGVETPRACGMLALRGSDEHFLVLRPWTVGRHPSAEGCDFVRLGDAIARVHLAMPSDDARFDQATARRIAIVAELQPGYETWSSVADTTLLRRLAGDAPHDAFTMLAQKLSAGAVGCHGDLHAGNILLRPDGEPVLLDFEECLHSRLDPMVDVARAMERCILVHGDAWGAASTLEAARRLVRGYERVRGVTLNLGLLDVALRFHRALAARLCLSLGDAASAAWQAEMGKLVALDSLHERQRGLLERLERSRGG